MALVKTVEMRVLAKSGDAQAKLDELAAEADKLGSDGIRMRFRVDDAEGKAQLDDIKAKADLLGFKDVSIKVKVDGAGRAIADLMAVKHEEEKASGGGGIGGLLSGIGGAISGGAGALPLVGGLAGSGPMGLAAVAGGLAALLPEVVAVGSGFAAAGAGAGAFALLAMPAVKSVTSAYTDLSTAQQAYQKAQAKEQLSPTTANQSAVTAAALNLKLANEQISKLPASERAAVKGISSLSAEFGKLSKAFAPQAFRVFADGLKVVNNLLPHLAPMANAFGNAMGGLLKQLDSVTRSSGFQQWLRQFTSLIGPAVTAIGQGIGGVAVQFGKLLTVFSGKDVAHGINIAFDAVKLAIQGVVLAIRGLKTAWDTISQNSTFKRIAGEFKTAWDQISATGKKKPDFSGLVTAVKDAVSTAIAWLNTKLTPLIHTALQTTADWLKAHAGSILIPVGRALMDGLISGIKSRIPSVGQAAQDIIGLFKNALTHGLMLSSPSRLTHQYGVWVVDGLTQGMNARLPALEKVAAKAGKIIADRIKTEISYAKGVASATVQGLGLTSIDLSQGNVATGMQSYLASIKAFIGEIKALTSQHLNKGILQQLIAAGPVTGGQYATSILQGGVGQVNSLYKQIQHQSALLGAQAAMSVYGGKAAPKGDTYTITVQGGLITDKQALAMEIVKVLREYKRHTHVPLGLG